MKYKRKIYYKGIIIINFILFIFCSFAYSQEELLSWIMGEVKDKDTGEPISGIVVMALKVENQKVVASYQDKTNSRGVYMITDVPSGDYLIFPYPAQGYVSNLPDATIYVPSARTGTNPVVVDFQLEKGGGVAGRVVKEDGSPVAGVTVIALIEGGNSGEAITDENGEYEIFGLTPTDNAVIVVSKEGYLDLYKDQIWIQKNQITHNINFIFNTLNILQGKVSDTLGNPITNANIIIGSETELGTVTTDTNGNYKIYGLPVGTYEVKTWALGYKVNEIDMMIMEGSNTLNIILEKTPLEGGWYYKPKYKDFMFAEDIYVEPKFILAGLPPGCCPCREGGKLQCPDCPLGIWSSLTTPQVVFNIKKPIIRFIGIETGIVSFYCGYDRTIKCIALYNCRIYGIVTWMISIAGAGVYGAPCIQDLSGKSRGIVAGTGIAGVTFLFGSSLYIEASIGIGGAIGYISCSTSKPACEHPCY